MKKFPITFLEKQFQEGKLNLKDIESMMIFEKRFIQFAYADALADMGFEYGKALERGFEYLQKEFGVENEK